MAEILTFKLRGVEQLISTFRTLPSEIQRKVALPAGKAAMDIVLRDAVERAQRLDDPSTPSNIALNIAMLEDKKYYEETGDLKISVGVRKGKRKGGNTWYWYYQELGTSTIRARPFLRPALQQNLSSVFTEFISAAKFELVRLGVT